MCPNSPFCDHDRYDAAPGGVVGEAVRKIGLHGYTFIAVHATPWFAYSVGLTPHGLPELLMEGEDPLRCHKLLEALATLLLDDPTLVADGAPVAVTPPGEDEPVILNLLAPTKATYLRAAVARKLYAADYRVRVVPVQPA